MAKSYKAKMLWGDAYDYIPKSVFAVLSWYLAHALCSEGALDIDAKQRAIEELKALREYRIIDRTQLDVAIRALGSNGQS